MSLNLTLQTEPIVIDQYRNNTSDLRVNVVQRPGNKYFDVACEACGTVDTNLTRDAAGNFAERHANTCRKLPRRFWIDTTAEGGAS